MAMGISRMACPHCEGVVHAVKTRPLSRLFKEITYMCRNPDCGHVFVAGLEVLRTLSLSSAPSRDVQIPLSQHARAAVVQLGLFDVEPPD